MATRLQEAPTMSLPKNIRRKSSGREKALLCKMTSPQQSATSLFGGDQNWKSFKASCRVNKYRARVELAPTERSPQRIQPLKSGAS